METIEDEVFLGRQIARQQHMSEETAKKVDGEVKKIVDMQVIKELKKYLPKKRMILHKLAEALTCIRNFKWRRNQRI